MELAEVRRLEVGDQVTVHVPWREMRELATVDVVDLDDDDLPIRVRFVSDNGLAWVPPCQAICHASASTFTVVIPGLRSVECMQSDVSYELYQLLSDANYIKEQSPVEWLTELIGEENIAKAIVAEASKNAVRNIIARLK